MTRSIPRPAVLALLCIAALTAGAGGARAQVFKPADVKTLVGRDDGAETRIQKFYHYFKKDRDPALTPPAWIDETLDAMLRRPVWQDPEEGILNEAQLWQAPVSVLYEFFELTRKTMLPSDGGQLAPPASLARDYEDNRIRFQMSMDRLYRARLGGSLGGRARPILADFDLIMKEMDSVLDGLTSGDMERYREAVLAIGALSSNAFAVLSEPPRGFRSGQESRGESPLPLVFVLGGITLMFLAGWTAGTLNDDQIHDYIDRYKAKAKEWAHEYERQFLTIKVNYLVGGPAVFGMLLGLLTFDPFGFLMCTGLGVYAGLSLPGWLLRNVRFRRGLKVESQLMDAMILMSNGLRSGVDLVGCLGMVQKDLQPPISEEFGLVIKNYQLGMSLEKALEGMEERVGSRLLAYMIKAVVIQRSVGGNLTKIFDRIVENIREESKLTEKTAALTAQQRIQAIVVGLMPWIMLVVMFMFQPGPMKTYYFSPLGLMTLAFCTVWISIGMKVINKLGEINV